MTKINITPDPRFTQITLGNPNAPILVVCDSPGQYAYDNGAVCSKNEWDMLISSLTAAGFSDPNMFQYVVPCPTVPKHMWTSDAMKAKWAKAHEDMFLNLIGSRNFRAILCLGNLASRQVIGRAVQITKARGVPMLMEDIVILPAYSPGYVHRTEHLRPVFEADLRLLKKIVDANYDLTQLKTTKNSNYQYVTDIQFLLDNKPPLVAIDTETTGLKWYRGHYPFLLQITRQPGETFCVPLCRTFWPEYTDEQYTKVMAQVKEFLEDPTIKKIGHNIKYDNHILRNIDIKVRGWEHDTILMAYVADENMQSKSLDDCVLRWVPELAGYSSELQNTYNKADMINIPRDILLPYAGGDTDACLRIYNHLLPMIQEDTRHYKRYTNVLMPVTLLAGNVIEYHGMDVDVEYLETMERDFYVRMHELQEELMRLAPKKVRQAWIRRGPLDINKLDFVRDCIFSKDGLNLKPRVFTKSTEKNDKETQLPSTSFKTHLSLLVGEDTSGFLVKYGEYGKIKKLYTTMIDGFAAKYVSDRRKIHPSYAFHRAVTGRSTSEDPNGQNIPNHGPLAKTYKKMLKAPKGWVILDADLSQAELRIAGEMALDPVIMNAYMNGEDLHTVTAALIMSISLEEFKQLDPKIRKEKRQAAKAVNFGLIYGMSAATLQIYAKLTYGVDMTLAEAENVRLRFFQKYAGLRPWHTQMIATARKHKFVRSLHGYKRQLPTIDSADRGVSSLAERQAINSPVQLIASDINIIAAIRFQRDANPDDCYIIQLVHDNIKCMVREEHVQFYAKALKWYMENPPMKEWFGIDLKTPVVAELAWGPTQAELKEVGDMIKEGLLAADLPAEPFPWYDATLDQMPVLETLGDFVY